MKGIDDFERRTLLFDFYGQLLTEHQQRIYREVVLEDYSVSEVAVDDGISRQGVHDLIKRCDRLLEDYESKLHLMDKFQNIKDRIKILKNNVGEEQQHELDEILEIL